MGVLKEKVENDIEFLLPEDYHQRYLSYKKNEWVNKAEKLINVLDGIYKEYSPSN